MKSILLILALGLVLLTDSCSSKTESKKGRVAISGLCHQCNPANVQEMKKVFEAKLQKMGVKDMSVKTGHDTIYIETFGYGDWHRLRDTLPQGIPGHRFIIIEEAIGGPALGE